jgi:hypothetical protein
MTAQGDEAGALRALRLFRGAAMPFDDSTLETYNRRPRTRLAKGAHDDPRSGVCILEAALAAAGYPHQAIMDADEMPPEFSPVLCDFAMAVCDAVPDGWRDALLYPFITGLAGTAASPEVEDAREAYIVGEVYRRIVGEEYEPAALFLDVVNDIELTDHPQKWEIAGQILDEAMSVVA